MNAALEQRQRKAWHGYDFDIDSDVKEFTQSNYVQRGRTPPVPGGGSPLGTGYGRGTDDDFYWVAVGLLNEWYLEKWRKDDRRPSVKETLRMAEDYLEEVAKQTGECIPNVKGRTLKDKADYMTGWLGSRDMHTISKVVRNTARSQGA